jgi:hypothetical protein
MANVHTDLYSFAPYGDPFAFFDAPPAQGDGQPGGNGGQGDSPSTGTPAEKGKGEGGDPFPSSWEDVFKHPRFKELTDTNRTLKEQLTQHEEEKAKAAEKKEQEENQALKDKEQFKTLAEKTEEKLTAAKEENKTLKAQVKKYEEIAAADIEARLGAYPEPLQKLLTPLLDGKSPIDQLQILQDQADTITALLGEPAGDNGEKKRLPKGVPPTPTGDDPEKISEAKKAKYQKNYRQALRQGL